VSPGSLFNLLTGFLPAGSLPGRGGLGLFGLSSPAGIVNTFETLIPENDLIDADVCLPWAVLTEVSQQCVDDTSTNESLIDVDPYIPTGAAGEVDVDCQDDAGAGGVLVDGDVCALVSAAAEVNAQCQQNTGVQARSLVNPNVCAALAALGTASGTGATDGGDGVIDIAVCAPLGVLGSASICPPVTTPPTTPGGPTTTPGGGTPTTTPGGVSPSTTPGGPQGIRNPSGSGSGSLPTTGIAVAGFLVIATLLVMSGFGTRILGRMPQRRNQ